MIGDDISWSRNIRKTWKEHKCIGCEETIPAASPARSIAGRDGALFYSGVICMPCAEYLDRNCDRPEDTWSHGSLGMARREEEAQA